MTTHPAFIRVMSCTADRWIDLAVASIAEIRPTHTDGYQYVELHTSHSVRHIVWVGDHEPDAPTHRALDLFWDMVTEGAE